MRADILMVLLGACDGLKQRALDGPGDSMTKTAGTAIEMLEIGGARKKAPTQPKQQKQLRLFKKHPPSSLTVPIPKRGT